MLLYYLKTNDYSAQSEKVDKVVTKNKNNLKEKLWEKWEIVMLSDVESDMCTEFHSRFSF